MGEVTTGQLFFFAGVGLLAVTAVLAIIFAVRKPKYRPEAAGDGVTAPLRNGYPTDPLTVRRETAGKGPAPAAGTLPLAEETVPLAEETIPLADATVPLSGVTEALPETERLGNETEPL